MPKDKTKAMSKDFLSKYRVARVESAAKPGVKFSDVTGLEKKALMGMIYSVARAFEDADLDPNREADWRTIALILATAVYGGGGPGHPMIWTNAAHGALLAAVKSKQLEKPNLSDSRCCEFLVKEKGPYFGMKPGTLRRMLSRARQAKSSVSPAVLDEQEDETVH